jgi:hypothetical protein
MKITKISRKNMEIVIPPATADPARRTGIYAVVGKA